MYDETMQLKLWNLSYTQNKMTFPTKGKIQQHPIVDNKQIITFVKVSTIKQVYLRTFLSNKYYDLCQDFRNSSLEI